MIARVSAQVVQPFSDRPFDGIFTITTELGPMASPAFEVGRFVLIILTLITTFLCIHERRPSDWLSNSRQTEVEVLLARLIEKSIRRSTALDTESLCIVAGQKCWQVRADVHFLNHDGGMVDAACIAVVAALQHFRRPDVSVEGETVTVHSMTERVPVPLSILHVPICVTFSYYDMDKAGMATNTLGGGSGGGAMEDDEDAGEDEENVVTLLDATLQEEQLRDGDMTVTMNKHGEVCQISKAGGVPLDPLSMHRDMNLALVKVKEITAFITKRLKEDEDNRVRRDNLLESTAENER